MGGGGREAKSSNRRENIVNKETKDVAGCYSRSYAASPAHRGRDELRRLCGVPGDVPHTVPVLVSH